MNLFNFKVCSFHDLTVLPEKDNVLLTCSRIFLAMKEMEVSVFKAH